MAGMTFESLSWGKSVGIGVLLVDPSLRGAHATKQSRKNWIAAPTMSAHDDEGYDVVEKRRKNGL
jgi:hypothetical protein